MSKRLVLAVFLVVLMTGCQVRPAAVPAMAGVWEPPIIEQPPNSEVRSVSPANPIQSPLVDGERHVSPANTIQSPSVDEERHVSPENPAAVEEPEELSFQSPPATEPETTPVSANPPAVNSPAVNPHTPANPAILLTPEQQNALAAVSGNDAAGSGASSTPPAPPPAQPSRPALTQNTRGPLDVEVRAVWISFLELGPWLRGRSEAQFTATVREAFDNIQEFGLNTVIVQVRPFADALYESAYFPWSHIATGVEGQNPGFDPLEIMVSEARARGLRIEAWINPYRIRHNVNTHPLAQNSPARAWINDGSGRATVAPSGFGTFNPASRDVQDLIINGVRELVRNYDIDGIHIDDYFYPQTGLDFDNTFDAASFRAYQAAGGRLSLGDWRRQNVDDLIRRMYFAIKEENPNALFGISPQSIVDVNYNRLFFDVERAVRAGHFDYIAPQIYFGFNHSTQPFAANLDTWSRMVAGTDVKLYIGLASYKAGVPDNWAGAGSAEWQNNSNIQARQVQLSRQANNYAGFILFRYDSVFRPDASIRAHVQRENANLRALLN